MAQYHSGVRTLDLPAMLGVTARRVTRFRSLARQLLLPVLFVNAMRGDDFVWRGSEM